MLESQICYLRENFKMSTLLFDEPMKGHTSFKIGGPADLFFIPKTVAQIKEMIRYCNRETIAYYIVGNGSNLLVSDKGYRGVIIQVYKNLSSVTIEENKVYAEAGVLLSRLAKEIHKNALQGFEFASGIPGTLGGAVYMNAGAYGGEIKDVLVDATVLSRQGDFRTVQNKDLDLDYRHSSLMAHGDIVVSANLAFEYGHIDEIKAKMDDFNGRRKDKQPLEKPSAGSTFKRPEGYYAGKLIMDAGLRGHHIGGAMVSNKHCGFVINTGDATCKDVLSLIGYVQSEVKKQFDVELETEVRLIGEL